MEFALRANEILGGVNPDFLETVAAAYAEDDRFDEAVAWQKKALQALDGKPRDGRKAGSDCMRLANRFECKTDLMNDRVKWNVL
ncbi:MAG: hypothetical protein O2960_08245 [Verrucomicrobia bacterium]|nr:hypothetical protein [Verrucomicrobiota bacterium]